MPTEAATGICYRFVKLKYSYDPISGIGALKAPGRYHLEGRFRALYMNESPEAALRETAFLLRTDDRVQFRPAPPMALFAIVFDLQHTIDLRKEATLTQLGVKREDLFKPWLRNTQESPSITQQLGFAAHSAGVQAMRAPSAVPPHDATNIIVFPDNLDPGGPSWVEVRDPEGTFAHRLPPDELRQNG